jgi:hypothetical protein
MAAPDRAQDAQRHHQQHGDRDRPALVQRGQAQEHGQQRKRQQHGGLRARELLLARLAGPLEAEARWQLAASRSISASASPVE